MIAQESRKLGSWVGCGFLALGLVQCFKFGDNTILRRTVSRDANLLDLTIIQTIIQ